MKVSYYDYMDLVKAVKEDANEESVNRLGEWFEIYGNAFFNGEVYEIDSNNQLRPLYKCFYDENGELDYAEVIGYELEH